MNTAFVVAAVLAFGSSAFDAFFGETFIFRRLSHEVLPATRLGNSEVTRGFLRGKWHFAPVTWIVMGSVLASCEGAGASATCKGAGRVAALTFGAHALYFVLYTIARSLGRRRNLMVLIRNPGWAILAAISMMAWVGAR